MNKCVYCNNPAWWFTSYKNWYSCEDHKDKMIKDVAWLSLSERQKAMWGGWQLLKWFLIAWFSMLAGLIIYIYLQ